MDGSSRPLKRSKKNSYGYDALCDVSDEFILMNDALPFSKFTVIDDGNLERINAVPIVNEDRYLVIKKEKPSVTNVKKSTIFSLILDDFDPSDDFKISNLFQVMSVELGPNFTPSPSFVDDLMNNSDIQVITVSTTDQLQTITKFKGIIPQQRILVIHIPLNDLSAESKQKIPELFRAIHINSVQYQTSDLWSAFDGIQIKKIGIRHLGNEDNFSIIDTILQSTEKLVIFVFRNNTALRQYCENHPEMSKIELLQERHDDYNQEVLETQYTPRLEANGIITPR